MQYEWRINSHSFSLRVPKLTPTFAFVTLSTVFRCARSSLAAALEENISMAKQHAIVLASLERRTRDAEAIAQAALARHDQQELEQQEQEQVEEEPQQKSLAQDSPAERSTTSASSRRVSFAAPTSPLPSMLRQAAKLSKGAADVPPEQHAMDADGLDNTEADNEEHAASYDANPTPSPLPRSAYTSVHSVDVGRDGTQSCVDLASENTATPVRCINLADEETTVQQDSVDTIEMPMAVYDEDTAVYPTDTVVAAEAATIFAVGIEMVPEEKRTTLAKNQEEEHMVQIVIDDDTENMLEDNEIVPECAAADPVSASATSARLADRQAERRHSMAAFEQRVQAAKASSPSTALQNSQSAAEDVPPQACRSKESKDEGDGKDDNDDSGNNNDQCPGNDKDIDNCSGEIGCFDSGNNLNEGTCPQEDAAVANPLTLLGGAPQTPTAPYLPLPTPAELEAEAEAEAVACPKVPSLGANITTPVAAAAAAAPALVATRTVSELGKEAQADVATSSSSPLPPYEPWELSPSAVAAAVATIMAEQPEPEPKKELAPPPPAPPPAPFRVSQIVWALDSRAPVDSPTAFWPAKVSALNFKPLPSSSPDTNSSDVPSCESSAPGSTTTGVAARTLEDSSKVVPGEWWLDVKFYTNYPAVSVAACNVKAWSDHQESPRASAMGALSVLRQVTGSSSSSSYHPYPSHKPAAVAPPGKKNKREAARSVAIAAARQEIANLEEAKVFAKRQAEAIAVRQRQQREEKRKEVKQEKGRKPLRKAPNQQAQLESPPLPQQGKEPGHMAVAAATAAASGASGNGRSSRPTSPVERLQALNFELQVRLKNDKSWQSQWTPKQASGMEVGSSESDTIEGPRRANAAELAPQSVRRPARVQPQSCGVCGCNLTNVPADDVRRSSSRTSRSTSSGGNGHLCDSCRASAPSSALTSGSRAFVAANSSELKPATTPSKSLAKSSESKDRQLRAPLSTKKNSQTTESLPASKHLND